MWFHRWVPLDERNTIQYMLQIASFKDELGRSSPQRLEALILTLDQLAQVSASMSANPKRMERIKKLRTITEELLEKRTKR
mgnify:CR=1 FL=1